MLALRVLVTVLLATGFTSAAGSSGDVVPRPAKRPKVVGCTVIVTGYNSMPNQTDSTPFLTAAQTRTRWGIVAANWLPLGAKVQVPGHFGKQVFIVEDRTHRRNGCKMDVWFAQGVEADKWGIKQVFVRVLEPKGFSCPSQPETVKHKCPEPS